MRKDKWYDYFQFTRKERTGIFFLLLLVLMFCYFPALFPVVFPVTPEFRNLENDSIYNELLVKTGPLASNNHRGGENLQNTIPQKGEKRELFVFDPNSVSENDWQALGVSDRTIKTIKNYLEKGGRFKVPSDIKKIYGLSPSLANKLMAYISIAKAGPKEEKFPDTTRFNSRYHTSKEVEKKSFGPIDINEADSLEWLSLKGIGPALTHRILKFRDKLGGFHSIAQVAEVYGLADSTFLLLQPFLSCRSNNVRKILINAATLEELEKHPYISRKLAKVVIAYRDQHGPFRSKEELENILITEPGQLMKLIPYVSVEEKRNY